MTLFQIPIIYTVIFALALSVLLNRIFLVLTKEFQKKSTKKEKRLNDTNVSPFGGIATSIAFFVSTLFLGKADEDFITIGICAVIISIIGLIDDVFNLNWKSKFLSLIHI